MKIIRVAFSYLNRVFRDHLLRTLNNFRVTPPISRKHSLRPLVNHQTLNSRLRIIKQVEQHKLCSLKSSIKTNNPSLNPLLHNLSSRMVVQRTNSIIISGQLLAAPAGHRLKRIQLRHSWSKN